MIELLLGFQLFIKKTRLASYKKFSFYVKIGDNKPSLFLDKVSDLLFKKISRLIKFKKVLAAS